MLAAPQLCRQVLCLVDPYNIAAETNCNGGSCMEKAAQGEAEGPGVRPLRNSCPWLSPLRVLWEGCPAK